MAIKWGLSVLDWHRHAVDQLASHPIGMMLLLLRRVHEGAITRFHGLYFDGRQRIWWTSAAAALGSLWRADALS